MQERLAFLRISVGTLFLIFGQYKVFGRQFTLHGGFQFWINKFLEDGAYPFMIPVLARVRTSSCYGNRVPGGVRRAGYRHGACLGSACKASQRLRTVVYAYLAVLRKLSRRASAVLAILRRLARPLGC